MSDLKMKALRVAVLKVLGDKLADADEDARGDLLAAMRDLGADKVTPELPDGTKVASISVAGGDKARARVVDGQAFLNWVKDHRPEEIEERVRDTYRKKLLEELAVTGEEVPGVELGTSRPYLSQRFKDGGKDAIAEAWTSGAIPIGQLLPLPAGGEGA